MTDELLTADEPEFLRVANAVTTSLNDLYEPGEVVDAVSLISGITISLSHILEKSPDLGLAEHFVQFAMAVHGLNLRSDQVSPE